MDANQLTEIIRRVRRGEQIDVEAELSRQPGDTVVENLGRLWDQVRAVQLRLESVCLFQFDEGGLSFLPSGLRLEIDEVMNQLWYAADQFDVAVASLSEVANACSLLNDCRLPTGPAACSEAA